MIRRLGGPVGNGYRLSRFESSQSERTVTRSRCLTVEFYPEMADREATGCRPVGWWFESTSQDLWAV